MNVLLVGPGGMGSTHYHNYLEIPGARVAALVGASPADRENAEKWQLPLYGTIAEAAKALGGLTYSEGTEFKDNYVGDALALRGTGGRVTCIELKDAPTGDTLCGICVGMSRKDAFKKHEKTFHPDRAPGGLISVFMVCVDDDVFRGAVEPEFA